MQPEQERHEMRLNIVHESKAEEWVCEHCERTVVIQWGPKFKRIVTKRGEVNAIHHGSKGGLVLDPNALTLTPPTGTSQQTDENDLENHQIISDDLLDQLDQFFADLDNLDS